MVPDLNTVPAVDEVGVNEREAFLTFGQYFVFCSSDKRPPRDLAWVPRMRDRYDYLPGS